MMWVNRLAPASLLAVLLVFPASSQTGPSVSDRSQRALEAFLAREAAQQARRDRKFASGGQPEITGQVRAIVSSAGITPPNRAEASPQQLQRLRSSFEIEVAQKLVQFGFNPGDINRDPTVVPAAARFTRGEYTVADLGRLADLVVMGTITAVTDETLADRYRSTATLSNLRVLKGGAPGASVRVRQESGRAQEGRVLEVEGDLRETGKTYVLFLSSHLYAALAEGAIGTIGRGTRQGREPGYYVRFGAWYEVQPDGRLVAAAPGMPIAETLEALTAAIR
ncbi:MAG TPA: hypothetical protein VF605_02920 [Allosphingosinicella sp.]|jgi:hypothetical protein